MSTFKDHKDVPLDSTGNHLENPFVCLKVKLQSSFLNDKPIYNTNQVKVSGLNRYALDSNKRYQTPQTTKPQVFIYVPQLSS